MLLLSLSQTLTQTSVTLSNAVKQVRPCGLRLAECFLPTSTTAAMWKSLLTSRKKLFTFSFTLEGYELLFTLQQMRYIVFSVHLVSYSPVYHIIMPKGAWVRGHLRCFSLPFRDGWNERFTSDRERYVSACVWQSVCKNVCGCVHCSLCVCAALTASRDCQVGYGKMVMTALLLPGRPPTHCTRLAVTAMMC